MELPPPNVRRAKDRDAQDGVLAIEAKDHDHQTQARVSLRPARAAEAF